MHKEKGNSSALPPRRRMQNGGGGVTVEAEVGACPTKRLRRPNVRLNQSYYVSDSHVRLQQRWDAFKKDLEGARKSRTRKTLNVKNSKKSNGGGVNPDDGDGDDDDDDDDDVAIVNWKNSKLGKRVWDFNSKLNTKRVRPSNSESDNENFAVSSGGESENQMEDEIEEENLGANEVNVNVEPEDSDPHCSFGNDKLIDNDDDNNVVDKEGKIQSGLRSDQDLDDVEGETRTQEGEIGREIERGDGVREWLNELGLGKYAPLFEVHEVDDEVLPFLTLEDLKDMGISAVGSRRKMYLSIQKLGKGFS